jgi:hypothetical protein
MFGESKATLRERVRHAEWKSEELGRAIDRKETAIATLEASAREQAAFCKNLLGRVAESEALARKWKERMDQAQNWRLAADPPAAPFKDLELRTPEEVKMRLGELVDSSPILAAFVTVIKGQGEIETGAAICPGLSDSDRQYNAGRAAAVADMLHAISQCREEGMRMLEERGERMKDEG